jgi:CRP/FNR family cyclic AMP-dependent transcriptional regulator
MDLRVISLFQHLSDAELTRVRALCTLRSFTEEEVIVGDGDKTTDVFFILSGTVRVTSLTVDGREVIFSDVSAGGVFGEFSAIDGEPRSASGRAQSDCTLARMPSAVFRTLLRENNSVSQQLIALLVGKIRSMSERVFELSTLVVRQRLRRELLRMATTIGKPDGQGVMIRPAKREDIAARIGSHREAISREVSRLEHEQLIEAGTGWIRIIDLSRLKEAED